MGQFVEVYQYPNIQCHITFGTIIHHIQLSVAHFRLNRVWIVFSGFYLTPALTQLFGPLNMHNNCWESGVEYLEKISITCH